jgi:hypothetical protein
VSKIYSACCWILLWLCILPTPSILAVTASSWDIPQLLHLLGQFRGGVAQFTETKTLAVLKTPLVLTGTLTYQPPNRVEKHILTPFNERYAVEGDTLIIENSAKQRHQTLSLASYPAIWAFIESIRAPLTGNREALQRFYQVSLAGQPQQWILVLVPKEVDMAKLIRTIVIKGSADRIASIKVEETNGDSSVMTVEMLR